MQSNNNNIIEFDVPEDFKKHGVTRIYQTGPVVKTLCNNDKHIAVNFDINKLKTFGKNFREAAGKVITSNGTNASEFIEDLLMHIVNQATTFYEQRGGANTNNTTTNRSINNGQDQRQVAVMKYTLKRPDYEQLWETVKIAGKYYLISYDPTQCKILAVDQISESDSRVIVPYSEDGIEPYVFENMDELNQYIEIAKQETIGSLFRQARAWARTFYDTDTEEYTNLIAADVCFSYFQDKIGKTHYIFVYGDPDQGKGSILETLNQLGYRAVQITDATAATVYRMLGSVEKGQVILVIDEANKIEDNTFLLNVLKVGYKGNTKIPRVMDAQSSQNNKIEYFYAYGFKIIAAEKLPDLWKTGGFLSRCFKIRTAPGDPKIDIADVIDNAGDPENMAIMAKLTKLRKTLFAYRLLHYHEPIPDIKIKGIAGRDRELTKPLIRLFKTHCGNDLDALDIIKSTMHYFIKERNSDKSDSVNAAILKIVKNLIQLDPNNNDNGELSYKDIWESVKAQFNGKPVDDKPDTLSTDLYGEIGSKKLTGILRGLGGKKARDSSGDKRVWKFDLKTLNRFSRVYKEIPETIEVEEPPTFLMSMAAGMEEQGQEREEEEEDEEE